MTINQAILSLWSEHPELTALVPAASVYAGRVPVGTAMPYATIEQPSASGSGRSNQSQYVDVAVRISLYAATYAAGQEAANALEDALSNREIELGDGAKLLDILHETTSSAREEDPEEPAWRFIVQFSARRIRRRVW